MFLFDNINDKSEMEGLNAFLKSGGYKRTESIAVATLALLIFLPDLLWFVSTLSNPNTPLRMVNVLN